VVLEFGDDLGHLRANVFQEGGNDENPETDQIQAKGPSGEGQSPRVEKDEGPSGEGLRPRGRDTIKTINCC